MKALNFLDFTKNKLKDSGTLWNDLLDWSNFYSQEFKPEMIVELFEGFEELQWATGGKLYEVHRKIRIYKHKGKEVFHYERMNDKDTLWIPFVVSITPRSIDEFVSECNKRGIELIWKSEVEKHFK